MALRCDLNPIRDFPFTMPASTLDSAFEGWTKDHMMFFRSNTCAKSLCYNLFRVCEGCLGFPAVRTTSELETLEEGSGSRALELSYREPSNCNPGMNPGHVHLNVTITSMAFHHLA